MTTTPADPAVIDLDVIRRRYCTGDSFQGGSICVGDISGLIAAVEALRARVAELEVFTGHLRASRDHAVQANEAAEAREVELAGALSELLDAHWPLVEDSDHEDPVCAKARKILAGTSAEVLERARARGAVLKAARFFMEDGIAEDSPDLNRVAWQALDEALAKLDALGKEEE